MDPLDELARIMNDTDTPKPNSNPRDASQSADDPLDLGLGDHGLAELFGEPSPDGAAPRRDLDLELSVDPAAPTPDELFSDLDFNTADLPSFNDPELDAASVPEPLPEPLPDFAPAPPPLPEPVVAPEPPAEAPVHAAMELPREEPLEPSLEPQREPEMAALTLGARRAAPSLSIPAEPAAYEPEPDPFGSVKEDDLLAAMDAIELNEPAMAASAPASGAMAPPPSSVAPVSMAPASARTATTTNQTDFSFGADTLEDDLAASEFPGLDDHQADAYGTSQPEERGAGPGKMIIFGLAALAVVGVGGVIGFGLLTGGHAEGDAPQVIAAPEGDDKVEPVVAEDTQARPGDAAFSALDDNNTGTSSSPRVVLPSPSGDGLPLRAGEQLPGADIAPAPPGSTASRAVRTVTVRADGTVVESTAPAAGTADVQAPAAESRPVEVVSVSPDGVQVNPGLGEDAAQALRTAVQDAAQSAAQALSSSTNPPAPIARPTGIVAQAPAAQVQPVQTQPIQAQTAAPPPLAPPAQTDNRVTPIQLAAPAAAPAQVATAPAASTPAPAATPASVPAGNFIVQLASLRSEAEARSTFTNLQNRFGSILSGFGPNIQRADLGDRGIYHRVRVGPMERSAADSLCRRYQSAGGDCFVQRQ